MLLGDESDHGHNTLTERLKTLLQTLHQQSSPEIINPSCRKRAAVALIIRIRPSFDDAASRFDTPSMLAHKKFEDGLTTFFSQGWVQRGEPEVLFIRRAARKGDRWTGHVALPGGKRDPSDAGDQYTSVRETMEEVGIDLKADGVLPIGTLPQRTVATVFDNVPLMELSAHVYLITGSDPPQLRLQPSEIAAAHWCSLRAMLVRSLRTYESCDISERLRVRGDWVIRSSTRAVLGKMLYPATRLVPCESLYSNPTTRLLSDQDVVADSLANLKFTAIGWLLSNHLPTGHAERPLLLWGLTHGIVTDFLELLPPYRTSELWAWPTFTHWDIRFVLWLVTFQYRRGKLSSAMTSPSAPMIAAEGFVAQSSLQKRRHPLFNTEIIQPGKPKPAEFTGSFVVYLLDGYFELIKRAVAITLTIRLAFGFVLVALIFNRFRYQSCF